MLSLNFILSQDYQEDETEQGITTAEILQVLQK